MLGTRYVLTLNVQTDAQLNICCLSIFLIRIMIQSLYLFGDNILFWCWNTTNNLIGSHNASNVGNSQNPPSISEEKSKSYKISLKKITNLKKHPRCQSLLRHASHPKGNIPSHNSNPKYKDRQKWLTIRRPYLRSTARRLFALLPKIQKKLAPIPEQSAEDLSTIRYTALIACQLLLRRSNGGTLNLVKVESGSS